MHKPRHRCKKLDQHWPATPRALFRNNRSSVDHQYVLKMRFYYQAAHFTPSPARTKHGLVAEPPESARRPWRSPSLRCALAETSNINPHRDRNYFSLKCQQTRAQRSPRATTSTSLFHMVRKWQSEGPLSESGPKAPKASGPAKTSESKTVWQ